MAGKYYLQTRIDAEIAHRLYAVDTYSEECRNNIHGHSYKFTFVLSCDHLNKAGMVVDFKLLKKVLRENIEAPYDHSVIVKEDDPLCEPLVKNCKKVHVVKENPTAEWMAKFYFDLANEALKKEPLIDNKVYVTECKVQETENNIAIYKEE